MGSRKEQILIADNFGNRFYEFHMEAGTISGYDYTLRRIVKGENVVLPILLYKIICWGNTSSEFSSEL